MFYTNKDGVIEFNGKKVILAFINAYSRRDMRCNLGESEYKIINEVGRRLTAQIFSI